MINKYFFTVLFSAILYTGLSAQVFVKHDADGDNDGSSWQDAYTHLEDALASNPMDAIWVASGTYTPSMIGSTPDSTWFSITSDVIMYGGFTGTESFSWERNPLANPTILSADLNGDDPPGDLVTNRTDNSIHVLLMDSTITNACVIDGFVIASGHAMDNPPGGEPDNWDYYQGAGLLSFGAPTIRNCIFRDHYAYADCALTFYGEHASGIIIDSCTFSNNKGQYLGGAVGGAYVSGFLITNSQFINNSIGNNVNNRSAGALFLGDANGSIVNCYFSQNTAPFGGAIEVSMAGEDNFSLLIDQCIFEDNEATLSGGAIIAAGFNPDYLLEIAITNSVFTNNQGGNIVTNNGGGGAVEIQNYATATIEESSFSGNSAYVGGAINFLAGGQGTVSNCVFENNTALLGGAIDINSISNLGLRAASATIEESVFRDNTAGDSGGAILGFLQGSATIRECDFFNNEAPYAGAVGLVGAPNGNIRPTLSIDACLFNGNHADLEGGAIDFAEAQDVEITNCLFTENTGPGSAIYAYATQANACNAFIYNNTIANNEIGIQLRDNTSFLLQNNIFFNSSDAHYLAEGSAEFFSGGGNLADDLSLETLLTDPSDIHGTDPLFVASDDFHLSSESPCVDAGIATDITALFDLEGNNRIQGNSIDIGAYESPFTVDTKEQVLADHDQLDLFPNPVQDQLNILLENEWRGRVLLELINAQGQIVYSRQLSKELERWEQKILVAGWPAGMYQLRLRTNNSALVKEWVKL
jgi:parallel beta-helix repeat protein